MRLKLWSSCIFFLALTQVVPLIAQEEEEPIPPPRKQNAPKVGGAGGFTPVFLFWDVNAFNDQLPPTAAKFNKVPMALYGGSGYAYIMLMDNLRVGGMGLSGSTKSSSLIGNVRRDVDVTIGFGGVTIEYAVPILVRLDVVPGIMLGGGGMDITMTRDDGSFKSWGPVWNDFDLNTGTQNVSRKLQGSFFVYQPSVYVEFALLRWIGLRAGVSYVGMASPTWKIDRDQDLSDVPSTVRGQGWSISTGVFLGTFLY